MVLIPIRSPLLSLCITITSVICELAFLTAALSFLRFRACRRLQKKKKVPVSAQHRRVLAVTLFAMLAFVSLETVTSIFSDPQRRQLIEIQPCLRNLLGVQNSGTNRTEANQAEAMHFLCTKIDGIQVSHFEANRSAITDDTTCSVKPMYSYEIGERITLPSRGATRGCQFQTCAFVALDNDTLLISGLQRKDDKEAIFLPSTVDPDDSQRLNLKYIADQVSKAYEDSITEEGEVRRRSLVGVINDDCPFARDNGPATTIPLAVLVGAAIVWLSSLLFFFASLFVRKRIFFDITHPMHWARKARHDRSRAMGNDPELEMTEVDGEMLITVTGYMPARFVD